MTAASEGCPTTSTPTAPLVAPSIAIVGAGFSGTLLALHLLQRSPPQTRVILIERNAQFGRGAAYSTGNSSHLLNVPAGKMSAFHSRPLDFLHWLQGLPESELCGLDPGPGTFVPRRLFGGYVRHLVNLEMKVPERGDQLELVRGDVLDIAPNGGGLTLTLDRNRTIEADRAVLAIGNFPPAAPPVEETAFYDSPAYKPDPWAADTLADLDPDLPVLLIGTGLTTIDTIVSLLDQGHRAPITALSRRGLVPHRHAAGAASSAPETDQFPTRLNALARALRRSSALQVASRRQLAGRDRRDQADHHRPVADHVSGGPAAFPPAHASVVGYPSPSCVRARRRPDRGRAGKRPAQDTRRPDPLVSADDAGRTGGRGVQAAFPAGSGERERRPGDQLRRSRRRL